MATGAQFMDHTAADVGQLVGGAGALGAAETIEAVNAIETGF